MNKLLIALISGLLVLVVAAHLSQADPRQTPQIVDETDDEDEDENEDMNENENRDVPEALHQITVGASALHMNNRLHNGHNTMPLVDRKKLGCSEKKTKKACVACCEQNRGTMRSFKRPNNKHKLSIFSRHTTHTCLCNYESTARADVFQVSQTDVDKLFARDEDDEDEDQNN